VCDDIACEECLNESAGMCYGCIGGYIISEDQYGVGTCGGILLLEIITFIR
jgi:hypothetical protein